MTTVMAKASETLMRGGISLLPRIGALEISRQDAGQREDEGGQPGGELCAGEADHGIKST